MYSNKYQSNKGLIWATNKDKRIAFLALHRDATSEGLKGEKAVNQAYSQVLKLYQTYPCPSDESFQTKEAAKEEQIDSLKRDEEETKPF